LLVEHFAQYASVIGHDGLTLHPATVVALGVTRDQADGEAYLPWELVVVTFLTLLSA
jgi:hypothetical protein